MVDLKISKAGRGNLSFNRLLFLRKTMTCQEAHMAIFKYFSRCYDDPPDEQKALEFYKTRSRYTLQFIKNDKGCDLPFDSQSFDKYTQYETGTVIPLHQIWNSDCPGVGLRLLDKCSEVAPSSLNSSSAKSVTL